MSGGAKQRRHGVELPAGKSASALLYETLRSLADRVGSPFSDALSADARAFRREYAESLLQFEARRVARTDRVETATVLAELGREPFVLASEGDERSLDAVMSAGAEPLPIERTPLAGAGGLAPALPDDARVFGVDAFRDQMDRWHDEGRMTAAALRALHWSLDLARGSGGELDLRGERFAVLGAGAELAPTLPLLEAGARVLWIDRVEPPEGLTKQSELSGELCFVPGGADLLEQPAEIAATVARFAEDQPVHLGLYAYAPGAGREWRLEAAMNAIAEHLDAPLASVALLVSPTSPAVLEPEERVAADLRRTDRPAWQALLDRLARFPLGVVDFEGLALPRSLVPIQGTAYQAAQYLAKRMQAEAWLARGPGGQTAAISANVAPISQTRSLEHPIFSAAFGGARAFGVETYPAPITRAVMTWLMLHDVLNPEAPARAGAAGAERARRAAAQQFHGGLYGLPYALDPALRYAAVLGFARRPGLLGRFFR